MMVQEKISLFYWMREFTGLVFLVGVVLFVAELLA